MPPPPPPSREQVRHNFKQEHMKIVFRVFLLLVILQAVMTQIESGVEKLRTQFPHRVDPADTWPTVLREVFTFLLQEDYVEASLTSARGLDSVLQLRPDRLSFWENRLNGISLPEGSQSFRTLNENFQRLLFRTILPYVDYVSQTWAYKHGSWTKLVLNRQTDGQRVSNTHPDKTHLITLCLLALKILRVVAQFCEEEVRRLQAHILNFNDLPCLFVWPWALRCEVQYEKLHHMIFLQLLHIMTSCRMMQPEQVLTTHGMERLELLFTRVKVHLCHYVTEFVIRPTTTSRESFVKGICHDSFMYAGARQAVQTLYAATFDATMSEREKAHWKAMLAALLLDDDAFQSKVVKLLRPFLRRV
jgi:hypothetical protein